MAKTKRLGMLEAVRPSKEDWKCPLCHGELLKKLDTGEGIKHCKNCNHGWFIILTSRPK